MNNGPLRTIVQAAVNACGLRRCFELGSVAMIGAKRPPGTERSAWLADLATAINEAEQLAWRLGYGEGDSADARALFTRLGALRIEVQALRSGGITAAAPTELDPFWLNLFPQS